MPVNYRLKAVVLCIVAASKLSIQSLLDWVIDVFTLMAGFLLAAANTRCIFFKVKERTDNSLTTVWKLTCVLFHEPALFLRKTMSEQR